MVFFSAATLLCHSIFAYGLAAAATQPNIVFILTDDQDAHMQSVQHMPNLQRLIGEQGTTFERHFCSVALCCPARATIWTGRSSHNTNVTDVNPPYGGYPQVVKVGINDNYLPIWMQNAGYNTYYTGKLWNAQNVTNYNTPFANGWNGSDFLLDPYTYQYFNPGMTRNGAPPVIYTGNYTVDLIAEKALGFLDEAANQSAPFMLVAAPVASHSEVTYPNGGTNISMPQYKPQYADMFTNYTIPRTPDFNPANMTAANWIAMIPQLNDTVLAYNDEYQRARLRSLQSVDEMVENIVNSLDEKGLLNNTYIFYTTDNGFHISQHRMLPGKSCGYDTDINIPLLIRGPGVPKNVTKYSISNHQDFSPTIMQLAGQPLSETYQFDGVPIPLYDGFTNATKQENVDVEHWGRVPDEGMYHYAPEVIGQTNTFKSVRIIGGNYSLYYSVWCTNEKQYYDMDTDPWQLNNLLAGPSGNGTGPIPDITSINGRPFSAVLDRVDALLMVLKACKGIYCTRPWLQLHPTGDVSNLGEALDPEFDEFYATQPKIHFSECADGYILADEGPQNVNVYAGNVTGSIPIITMPATTTV